MATHFTNILHKYMLSHSYFCIYTFQSLYKHATNLDYKINLHCHVCVNIFVNAKTHNKKIYYNDCINIFDHFVQKKSRHLDLNK